ncbi:hypothetical protein VPH35_088542 [Triticum aestivum]
MASVCAWSDLPGELLRIIIAGLPDPVDHVRFRAVCRSWRSVPSPRRLSMVVLPQGFNVPSPLPENQRLIGSTDCFLAHDYTHAENRHTYELMNPFARTTVALLELDAVIGSVPNTFEIHKVLMHSGLHGLVAIRTNNCNHPIILLNSGKGVWLPDKPRDQPFPSIIDVAFLGDTLYAIAQAEDLMSFSIALDSHGIPMVTSIDRIVTGVVVNVEKDKHVLRKRPGDYIINDGMHIVRDRERPHVDIVTIRYVVESRGKLLMVRREMERPSDLCGFTRKVEVFEADVSANTWVPMSTGLHGHALFLSKHCSKSVFAGDEIEGGAIYFIDNGKVFNLRFKTTSPHIQISILLQCGSFILVRSRS